MGDTGTTASYYVDEAGDFTLFNRRGVPIVGRHGVSKCVMVGVAHVEDPVAAHDALEGLRHNLLQDPYFRKVPSMQPGARKTAACFHAKDDLPEVRREVFHLLQQLNVKVQVAIRRKDILAEHAKTRMRLGGKKLTANELYDDMVKRLFKNLLHKNDTNIITFAQRGKTDRQQALSSAIQRAKSNFERKWGCEIDKEIALRSLKPSEAVGLQIVDYYLWALQRLYERYEDRFFLLLAPRFRLIMDLDDTTKKPYGEWYCDTNPLEMHKIRPVTG